MIDHTRIVSAVATVRAGAKRRATADKIQKWSPYYAGYSLEFASAVLEGAALPREARILDPWNGSGTTTLAATRLGLRSVGFDLNPYAVLVARARLVSTQDAQAALGLVRTIASAEPESMPVVPSDPLREWLSASDVAEFRRIQRSLTEMLASPRGSPLTVGDDLFPPLASFLILALVRAARSMVRRRTTSNPTAFKASARRVRRTGGVLADVWNAAATQMGAELPTITGAPSVADVRVGDARDMPIGESSVDFVLTSPPYCTRLDYGDAMRFELAAAAPEAMTNFPSLRRELMGAPLVRDRAKPAIPTGWPPSLKELLGRIAAHPSKASPSYYYKTYYQYFSDAERSLSCIAAALKPNATAAIVVQDSYYKEIKVDLAALYIDLGATVGLHAVGVHHMPVRTVLSTIHPGTARYRPNWSYGESMLLVQKR